MGALAANEILIRKKRFIDAFAECGNITLSARQAGIDPSTYYAWRESDASFEDRVAMARKTATDLVEAEIHRRAVLGIDKPVYYKGKRVDTIKEYSDLLLIFHAKKLMPEYRDNYTVTHQGPGGGPIEVRAIVDHYPAGTIIDHDPNEPPPSDE